MFIVWVIYKIVPSKQLLLLASNDICLSPTAMGRM